MSTNSSNDKTESAAHQSKLKGMLSGPKFDENTFLNSSKVIVPDESLQQISFLLSGSKHVDSHIKILEGNPIICVRSF